MQQDEIERIKIMNNKLQNELKSTKETLNKESEKIMQEWEQKLQELAYEVDTKNDSLKKSKSIMDQLRKEIAEKQYFVEKIERQKMETLHFNQTKKEELSAQLTEKDEELFKIIDQKKQLVKKTNDEMDNYKQEISQLQAEISNKKSEISELHGEVSDLKTDTDMHNEEKQEIIQTNNNKISELKALYNSSDQN